MSWTVPEVGKIEEVVAALAFNADGLIPAIAQDASSGQVLMLAWQNAEAVRRTLESGDVWYFSRSRQAMWRKGATSGNIQRLKSFVYDCDADTVLMQIDQTGPACHTGAPHCFFRKVSGV
ncbi:MAG: phosphoribosyl-AMP cyclohydrolase [Pseudomonadota bacterium]